MAHPNLEPIREQHDQLRRLIQRSPFGHRVEVESANISVIAVKHLQRRPGYWQRRRRSGSPLSRPSFKIGFFESPLLFFTTILMTDMDPDNSVTAHKEGEGASLGANVRAWLALRACMNTD